MGKSKDLSDFDKGQIVMARRLGQSISQTAGLVGCSRCAVVSTYKKWTKEGQPVNRRQGHGRPRLIDALAERRVAHLVESNSKATVAEIAEKFNAACDQQVSEHTVHRSLLRMGLRRRRMVKVPSVHHQSRLQWAQEYQDWTIDQWKKVAWSGEAHFLLHNADGELFVHRLTEEEMAAGCTRESGEAGGGSVALWAVFCWETLGPCIPVDVTLPRTTYLNGVVEKAHNFMTMLFPDGSGLFQQDSASCHSGTIGQEWFEEHNKEFQVLAWPSNSPDLSPMEHMWGLLETQVQSMEATPHSLEELKETLLTFWCQLPEYTFRGLVEYMPQRIRTVLAAEEGCAQD